MEDPGTTRHLFVYGTLRRGAPMHGLLSEGLRFVSPARVRGRLYDMGAYPAFVDAADDASRVLGELFEFTEDPERLLEVLDRYEGESFERIVCAVAANDGRELRAFLYCFRGDPSRGRPIASGDYLASLALARVTARAGRGSPRD
jgi:gamma-glutamylcyclotransferase (GGCT)/AIG2-like uncharacterized protein YtfP